MDGMLAVLDENRQILTTNPKLLERLGLNAEECLGLRPGEALGCAHVEESPDGCGTTRWCASCGAALAIVASQVQGQPCERDCALQREGGNDLFLRVRCTPLLRDGKILTVIFLRDISQEQRLGVLERTFFHDVRGLITGVVGYADLLASNADSSTRHRLEPLLKASLRLAQEVELQGRLVREESTRISPRHESIRAEDLLLELRSLFESASIKHGIQIEVHGDLPSRLLHTDGGLVMRVLRNMVTNAFEASQPGGTVTIAYLEDGEQVRFEIGSQAVIPQEIQLRVFQRNFSTKPGTGRGLGTWSMRFFGEDLLGGQVSFTSEPGSGTVFRLQFKA
jgi:signal transduction histidine kinase